MNGKKTRVLDILLVEDNAGDARLLEEALAPSRDPRFRVTTVTRLGHAHQAVSERDFHAILLDLSLPDANGLNTVKTARKHFSKMPIVVMTGLDDEDIAVQAVQLGAQDYLVKGGTAPRDLIRTIRHAIERESMRVELEEARERERHLATHDSLTDLPNRQLFYEVMSNSLEYAERYRHTMVVMFLDLDGFKEVNDGYGHAAGDLVLKKTAARLKDCMRKSDEVARFGGDEFSILLPKIKREGDEVLVADKIRTAVERPVDLEDGAVRITASIGIALYPRDGSDPEVLMRKADASMYEAKVSGGNGIRGSAVETAGQRTETGRNDDDRA